MTDSKKNKVQEAETKRMIEKKKERVVERERLIKKNKGDRCKNKKTHNEEQTCESSKERG